MYGAGNSNGSRLAVLPKTNRVSADWDTRKDSVQMAVAAPLRTDNSICLVHHSVLLVGVCMDTYEVSHDGGSCARPAQCNVGGDDIQNSTSK